MSRAPPTFKAGRQSSESTCIFRELDRETVDELIDRIEVGESPSLMGKRPGHQNLLPLCRQYLNGGQIMDSNKKQACGSILPGSNAGAA